MNINSDNKKLNIQLCQYFKYLKILGVTIKNYKKDIQNNTCIHLIKAQPFFLKKNFNKKKNYFYFKFEKKIRKKNYLN